VTGAGAHGVAVVVGAGSRVGSSILDRLAEDGLVAIGLDSTLSRPDDGRPRRPDIASLDTGSAEELDRVALNIVAEHGGVDVWVNVAADGGYGPAALLGADAWQRSVGLTLSTTLHGALAAGRVMLPRRRGVIVNVSSIEAYGAIEGRAPIAVASAAITMLTQALGIEWASRGIRVVGVAHALGLADSAEIPHAVVQRRTPMDGDLLSEDVAEATAYLASDGASYIVGETIRVDGGWTAYQLF
jgi:NAD(P)-dependent dehydrogenase (short-subunit alcohol dehydrogenase family)